MSPLSEKQKGEWIISLEMVLWGFFPVITALSYARVPSMLSLAWSTVFATLFFFVLVVYKNNWSELRNILLWRYVALITLLNAVLFYGLYFTALKYTTPGNAAIIALSEVLTSFVFFNLFRSERISVGYIAGAGLMVAGAVIVLAPNFTHVNVGDFLILASAIVAPAGNLFQQKARKIASSEVVLFLRSILAIPILFMLAYLFGQHASLADVHASLLFLLINGLILFGFSKILWIEAIHRISVTKAIAFNGAAPFVTLLAAWALLHQAPTIWQLLSLVPLFIGILLLTDQLKWHKSTLV